MTVSCETNDDPHSTFLPRVSVSERVGNCSMALNCAPQLGKFVRTYPSPKPTRSVRNHLALPDGTFLPYERRGWTWRVSTCEQTCEQSSERNQRPPTLLVPVRPIETSMLDYVVVSSGFLIAIARGVSVLWGVGRATLGVGGTTDEYLAPPRPGARSPTRRACRDFSPNSSSLFSLVVVDTNDTVGSIARRKRRTRTRLPVHRCSFYPS